MQRPCFGYKRLSLIIESYWALALFDCVAKCFLIIQKFQQNAQAFWVASVYFRNEPLMSKDFLQFLKLLFLLKFITIYIQLSGSLSTNFPLCLNLKRRKIFNVKPKILSRNAGWICFHCISVPSYEQMLIIILKRIRRQTRDEIESVFYQNNAMSLGECTGWCM